MLGAMHWLGPLPGAILLQSALGCEQGMSSGPSHGVGFSQDWFALVEAIPSARRRQSFQ
jgi:hypothetical protein